MRKLTMKKFILLLIIFLAACSPKADTSRCIPASEKQLDFINYAVSSKQSSNFIKEGYAVKSTDFVNVYMVAVKIYGPGMENGNGPAVFAVAGDPASPNTWMSVDGFAKQFTDFPDAGRSDAEITSSSDGVSEAIACSKENN